MLEKFKQHILKKFPFLFKTKLLVAVSGGLDSVVLTHLLSKLGLQIALAHVNFQLRSEESDLDEAFVKNLGQQLKVPVFTKKSDTSLYAKENKVSIQMAAREIRYDWFASLLEEKNYDFVLTAHHLDDNLETFFINLSRSSGLDGLTGIPERNKKIVRPLLAFSRTEILSYAKQNEIEWREDASNATTKYLRNKIRHKLLPILKEINPDFDKAFSVSQSHLKESQALVQDYISQIKPKLVVERNNLQYIALPKLKNFPNQQAILYELLKEYSFTEWNDVYHLLEAQTGKQVFSKTHYLLKDRENLVLGVRLSKAEDKKQEVIEVGSTFKIQNLEFNIEIIDKLNSLNFGKQNETFIDFSKIEYPLSVRKWKEGDYFYPLGLKGKKKISDFLIDQKISQIDKEKIWLLCDTEDQIIWVIGKRLDDRYKITKTTTKILKITTTDE